MNELLQILHQRFEYIPNDHGGPVFKYKGYVAGNNKKAEFAGTIGKNGYRIISINNKREYEHRLVWLWHHGEMPPMIDHINGNKLDNSITNLRIATRTQNAVNKKANKRSKSGIRGVTQVRSGRWKARIGIGYTTVNLGTFDTAEEAEAAFKAGAEKYHGSFAPHLSINNKPKHE